MMPKAINYLADADVNKQVDRQLRALLLECFGEAFRDKRYYFELPPHRWLVWDEDRPVAHLAIHEKVLYGENTTEPFIGVAEVCVAPPYRGRGLVRAMLEEAEAYFQDHRFSVLMGDFKVYGSSGYRPANNVYLPYLSETEPNSDILYKALGNHAWPKGKLRIPGPPF